jgi:hypothetical protein
VHAVLVLAIAAGTQLLPIAAEQARAQSRRIADQLRPKVPKLAALMDNAEPDVLAYKSFPAQHRVKLHSTSPLERLNGEIKRRTDVVGIFPNEDAITRVGAILLEHNDEWAVQRARYITLESIAPSVMIPSSGFQTLPPDQSGPSPGTLSLRRHLRHETGHDPIGPPSSERDELRTLVEIDHRRSNIGIHIARDLTRIAGPGPGRGARQRDLAAVATWREHRAAVAGTVTTGGRRHG